MVAQVALHRVAVAIELERQIIEIGDSVIERPRAVFALVVTLFSLIRLSSPVRPSGALPRKTTPAVELYRAQKFTPWPILHT